MKKISSLLLVVILILVGGIIGIRSANAENESVTLEARALNGTQVELNWATAEISMEDIKEYNIYSTQTEINSEEFVKLDTVEETTYLVSNLEKETTYKFYVEVVLNDDTVIPSNEVTIITPAVTIALETRALSGNEVELSWVAEGINEEDFSTYKVYRTPAPGEETNEDYVLVGTTENATITADNLVKNTEYTFYVEAVFNDESTIISNRVTMTTPVTTIALEARALNGNEVRLNWVAEDLDNENFSTYKVYRTPAPGEETNEDYVLVGTTENATITADNLVKSTEYTFYVEAVFNDESTIISNRVAKTTPATTIEVETNALNGNEVELSWISEDLDNENFVNYKVYRTPAPGEETNDAYVLVGTTENATITADNLVKNTEYTFYVEAVFNDESIIISNRVTMTTPRVVMTLEPEVYETDEIELYWASEGLDEETFAYYNIYRTPAPGEETDMGYILVGTTVNNEYIATNLERNTEYTFYIEAVFNDDSTYISNRADATTANEVTKYGLFANGKEFSNLRTTIKGGNGTAIFNYNNRTLTLNNVTLTNVADQVNGAVIYSGSNLTGALTIVLNGTNTINIKGNENGIYRQTGNITITGEGTLNINMAEANVHTSYSGEAIGTNYTYGDLILDGANININAEYNNNADRASFLISTNGVTITNSNLTIVGSFSTGIYASSNLNINNSNITINSSTSRHFEGETNEAILASSDINILGASNINIKDVDVGIKARESQWEGDIDRNINFSNESTIEISLIESHSSDTGGFTPSYPIIGNLNLNNYTGKIMLGYKKNGVNADLYNKTDFLKAFKTVVSEIHDGYEVEKLDYNTDILYLKFGNFDTYAVTNGTSPAGTMYLPSNAQPNETIKLNNIIKDDYGVEVYKLSSVKVLRASDSVDVTSLVSYNSSTKTFTMPNYPVTVKATFSKSFNLAPTTFTAKLYGHDDVKLSWKTVIESEGYKLYYKKSTSTNYVYLGKVKYSVETFKKANLLDGVKYDFKIIPYIEAYIPGANESDYTIKEIASGASKTVSIYTLKQLTTPKVTKYNNSYVRVSWSKINGATGYQVARSLYKTKNFTVLKTMNYSLATKPANTLVKTTKKKTYYYKMRAYRLVDGKRIYGPWSTVRAYTLR